MSLTVSGVCPFVCARVCARARSVAPFVSLFDFLLLLLWILGGDETSLPTTPPLHQTSCRPWSLEPSCIHQPTPLWRQGLNPLQVVYSSVRTQGRCKRWTRPDDASGLGFKGGNRRRANASGNTSHLARWLKDEARMLSRDCSQQHVIRRAVRAA